MRYIILPMAGRGERMLHRGPFKASIVLNGRTVFEWLLRSILEGITPDDILVIVLQRKDFITFKVNTEFTKVITGLGLSNSIEFVLLDDVLNGPARSIEKAISGLVEDYQVIIVNTDQYNSINLAAKGNWCSVGLDFGVSKSYIKIVNDRIVEIAEKNPISNICSTGIYSFKSVRYLKSLYVLAAHSESSGEFYLSHLVQTAIVRGHDFRFIQSQLRFDLGCEKGAVSFEKFISTIK